MSYRVVWTRAASRAAQTWTLSDPVFVEMHIQVNALAERPADLLIRTQEPVDGMSFVFQVIDPTNRLCVHIFSFHVVYSQDEETLFIARGTHFRRIG